MAMQSSGPISLQDIQDEFGGSHPISMSEYYGSDTVPSSGAISFNDFYGTSSCTPDVGTVSTYTSSGTYTLTSLACNSSIRVQLAGGGGGGAGFGVNGTNGYSSSGAGGSGGTTTVVHKRGGTTINTYTASGGSGGSGAVTALSRYANCYVIGGSTANVIGDSFSQTNISGTGGAIGGSCGGSLCPTGIGNGGHASGYGSGGAGCAYASAGDPWWDDSYFRYVWGGSVGSYTNITITNPQAGDTLVVTVGSGGSGAGNAYGCVSGFEYKKGGNGSAGVVRTQVLS